MTHTSTPSKLIEAFADHFLPELLKTEDFDAFEEFINCDMRKIAALSMAKCLESFDALLLQNIPQGWSVHERAKRRLITLLGEVSWTRTIFIDKYGRRRAWSDELLGIPKHTRISTNAFLWIVSCAAFNSYRRTSHAFYTLSGCLVSQVSVMRYVHEEGRLLRSVASANVCVSQDRIFTEVDGVWIHLQNSEHRKEALPRGIYEQARKTMSFELKMACIYAGKHKDKSGRTKRGNLCVIAADADPDMFWERLWKQIGTDYEIDDLEHIWLGSDGGSWCGKEYLEENVSESCTVEHSLDPFHIMQAIYRAFPEGDIRDKAQSFAFRRKPEELIELCEEACKLIAPGKQKEKVRELKRYISNHLDSVRFPNPSLGTMEGTIYHFAARRVKNNATSWSRHGAEAVVLIRCALLCKKDLIKPDKQVLFNEKEQATKERYIAGNVGHVTSSVGSGYEMPNSNISIPKTVAISIARRT